MADHTSDPMSLLQGSKFQNCVLGINSFVDVGCNLTNCLLMGNDNYNNKAAIDKQLQKKEIPIGIGEPQISSGGPSIRGH